MPDDRTSHDADVLTNYHTARADRVGGAVHSGKHVDQPKPDIGDAFNAAVLKLADEIERSCKAPNYEARLGTIEGKMVVAILRQAASQGNVGGEAVREALTLAYHELKKHDADYHHRTSSPESHEQAIRMAMDYECPVTKNRFNDFWDHGLEDYTFRFLWCCHAVRWAVGEVDRRRTSPISRPPSGGEA